MKKKTKKIEKTPPKEKHFMNTEQVLEEWSRDNDWCGKKKGKKT
jgi:hypothetical protein